jgi:ferric-dicitrate binding protein FerR (iron transport regulator)
MYELLNKYFAGTITPSERDVLFQEIDNDIALKEEFARMQNIMAISGMAHKEDDEQWAGRKMNELMRTAGRRRQRRVMISVLKYAAVAFFISFIWIIYAYQHSAKEAKDNSYTYIEAPKGQTIHIVLPDGTETWLSSRTKLTIPTRFNKTERTIELDGEAFFSVSRDEEKPFTVKTRQYNIQVTGTQFNVFAYNESRLFKTDLVEGSVFIYDKDDAGKTLHLNPEETAFLRDDGKLVKSYSTFSYSRYIMNGIYHFENISFKEIKDCLELWYNVKIHLSKEEISSYVFSGKFRQSDKIELILQAIKETGKFNYKLIDEYDIEIY